MKKKYSFLLACIIVLQLFSVQLFSQTNYYVATTAGGGSDTNAGTSLGAPFLTVSKALSKATTAGDTIFVRSGTYAMTSTLNASKTGTAAKRYVLTVYMPDMVTANSRPVFDFSAMSVGSSNRGMQVSGNYWTVYGIVFKGAGDNGMNVNGGSYCTIEFCDFTQNRDAGMQLSSGANHDNIINCDSYANADLGLGTTTNGGNADGFAAKLDIGDSIYFRGCRSWLNSDDGYDGYLRPSNNVSWTFEDCLAFRNGYYWKHPNLDSTTDDENGMGFKTGGSDDKDLAHNTILIRCLSFDNKGHGFDQNSNAGSISIYNCTAFRNVSNDIYMKSPSVTYVAGAKLTLENNLTFGAQGTSLAATSTAWPVTSITNTYNKTSATTDGEIVSFDTTNITAMRNVDGSLAAFTLMHLNTTASTPYKYIDKGTIVSNVYYHGALGIPYNNTAPDLGAFETTLSVTPVKMLSFTAVTNSAGVTLNWQIATQIQNEGWSVERTMDASGSSWTDLGFVNGAGTSDVTTDYSYLDKNVSAGTYYYRLKQVDINGNITYSNTIYVKIDNSTAALSITGYPNPFVSSATIRYTIPQNNTAVSLKVYDLQGQLISVLVNENEQAGTYQKLINGQRLSSGKYFLQLTAGGEIVTGAIVKE